jgi:hypothetical protein
MNASPLTIVYDGLRRETIDEVVITIRATLSPIEIAHSPDPTDLYSMVVAPAMC